MSRKKFNPVQFLSAVGAGGISIIPFAFLQYTFHSGKGLITVNDIGLESLPFSQNILFSVLMGIMILFGGLHLLLSIKLFSRYFVWKKSDSFKEMENSSSGNAALITPFISAGMTFNVFIAVIRFFIPALQRNFQNLMAPALIAWSLLAIALMIRETKFLKLIFASSEKEPIGFGWLLHPFALAMITVTGTGLAAMAASHLIAGTAAFISSVTGSLGFLLFGLFLSLAVVNQFKTGTLLSSDTMPAILTPVPIVTLFSISGFRLVHYFEKHFDFSMHWLAVLIVLGGFAFQTWYLLSSLVIMKGYFKKSYFRKGFHISHWSLICPVVAYAVLGSFLHKIFIPNPLLYGLIPTLTAGAAVLYGFTLFRQQTCRSAGIGTDNSGCRKAA